MFQEPLARLQPGSSTREVQPGEMLADLTSLSVWFAGTGIVAAFEGKSTQGLCDSFWCDFFYNTIMRLSFEKELEPKKHSLLSTAFVKESKPKGRISFNDQGLLLAKSFALGLVAEGEAIGYQSLAGLKDGRFYGLEVNKLTPFVLKLFAAWKNIELSAAEFPFRIPDAYQAVLDNLTGTADEIRAPIVSACDFHLSRSKEHTDNETYEFGTPVDAIYPAEILFVLRIRQLLGLSNPEVEHPLLNSPLGKLPESACSIPPALMPVRDRLR